MDFYEYICFIVIHTMIFIRLLNMPLYSRTAMHSYIYYSVAQPNVAFN